MEKQKVLFVSQEIYPYLADNAVISQISRFLPQYIQEKGKEIRTFMPKFGHINERRNQLHEVIRLSGMNLIINDTDHPLIIKVASIQSARMQVYFIENEDYFQRKFMFRDKNNKFFRDNDERAVFFNRGVIETIKKLGWAPNIISLHGWMSALTAFYIKTAYKDNPLFYDSKIILSIYNDYFPESFSCDMYKKVQTPDISAEEVEPFRKKPDYLTLMKTCLKYVDGVIFVEEGIHPEIVSFVEQRNIPTLYHEEEKYLEQYNNFFEEVYANETEEVFS